MKCVVLAFDGLEYNLVKKFDLMTLKQEEYGKVRIPKTCYRKVKSPQFNEAHLEPYTPLVWFSFLTGKLPARDTFSYKKWDNQFLDALQSLTTKVGLGRIKNKGKLFRLLGFSFRNLEKQDYTVPTIFDLAERSHAINIPIYSKDRSFNLDENPDDFDNFKDFVDTVLTNQMRKFHELKERALRSLEQQDDWDLFMVYFKTLDHYGELCFGNIQRLKDAYSKFDRFVAEVNDKVKNSFVLIISDHGMERLGKTPFGKHSNYAFYSINMQLKLKKPKITDFYTLIKSVLNTDRLTKDSLKGLTEN